MGRLQLCFLVLCAVAGCGDAPPGEVQLEPPAAGAGWQWRVDFPVPAGTEIQSCHFFAVPGAPGEDVWVDRVTVAQNVGSHHMSIFRVKTVIGLSGQPGDIVTNGPCFSPSSNWSDWPLVVNSQDAGDVDWKLPESVGMKFRAGELLMLQSQFVDANTQKAPFGGKVLVNFYTPTSPPANELGTLFATNLSIRVCPGDVDRAFTASCKLRRSGVHVIAANGHFHSRGKVFTMATVDAQGRVGSSFYESRAWDGPPMTRALDVVVPENGGVTWKCTFDHACPQGAATCGNPLDGRCFTSGPHVETQEHCHAFVYYWPKAADVDCF